MPPQPAESNDDLLGSEHTLEARTAIWNWIKAHPRQLLDRMCDAGVLVNDDGLRRFYTIVPPHEHDWYVWHFTPKQIEWACHNDCDEHIKTPNHYPVQGLG